MSQTNLRLIWATNGCTEERRNTAHTWLLPCSFHHQPLGTGTSPLYLAILLCAAGRRWGIEATLEEAAAQIESFYNAGYTLTLTGRDGKTEKIKGSQIGFKVAVPEGLQAILDEQNAAGRVYGPSVDNSHTMTMENMS